MIIHEFFPEPYIQLQKELATAYHPKLVSILSRILAEDIDLKLAQIAAYCEVVLDGTYTLEDREKLCDILRQKLILKRENPNSSIVIIN